MRHRETSFHHCGGPVKLVEAWLCARRHLESSFHHCGGSVKLVQACLCARKARKSSFHPCGGAVNLIEAWLCTRRHLESSLLIINLFLHIIGHKETSEEQLSPSKRMKTEGSNAELIV